MGNGRPSTKFKSAQAGYLLITASLSLIQSAAYAAEQVAVVIGAEGSATAGSRALTRHSAIYQGETITTAAGGKVAFKFTDGSIVTLKEKSSYVIKNYSFNKGKAPDTFDAHLLKGGLKTVTGTIGKEAQHTQDAIAAGIPANQQVKVSNYKVKAAVATIGVRGTDYKCSIEESLGAIESDKLLLSVQEGGIDADFQSSNGEDTSIDLGLGADASYAQIDADGNATYLSSDPISDADFDIEDEDDEDSGDDDEEDSAESDDEDEGGGSDEGE